MDRLTPAVFVPLSLFIGSAQAHAQVWEEVSEEDGIQVWQRETPSTSLVEFRGRGFIDADLRQILAVLHDDTRKAEWMENCVENRRLRAYTPGHAILYNRTGSPVPLISERDVVLETALSVWREKRQVRIDVWNVDDPLAPPVSGVVRMPKLIASWVLVVHGPKKVEATYQVRADPGGWLPHWLVNMVSKKMPHYTIANLRKQVTKDGYDKDLAIIEAAYDWESVERQMHEVAKADH